MKYLRAVKHEFGRHTYKGNIDLCNDINWADAGKLKTLRLVTERAMATVYMHILCSENLVNFDN